MQWAEHLYYLIIKSDHKINKILFKIQAEIFEIEYITNENYYIVPFTSYNKYLYDIDYNIGIIIITKWNYQISIT